MFLLCVMILLTGARIYAWKWNSYKQNQPDNSRSRKNSCNNFFKRLAPVYAYQSFVYTLSNTNHFLFAEQPRAMTSLGVLCMLL